MAGSTADAGQILDLEIGDVAHGGIFVARHEGRVVFVPDVLPGERVRARLTDTRKSSFWRAEALEVTDASPHRRPHVWRQADLDVAPERRPGGADFGHIELAHQRELKRRVLTDALRRFGGTADASPDVSPVGDETPDGTGWRTRVSLHVDGEGSIGPYAARSHRVIAVDDHPLATAAVERAAMSLRGGEAGRIDLVQPADGRVRVLPRPEAPRRGGRRPQPARASEVVSEEVDGRRFLVDVDGFWQVHRSAATTLTAAVRTAIRSAGGVDPDAWHLDLYGGVGLFAAAIAQEGGPSTRITTVESDSRATDHAGENLAEWVGARAETGRVDRWLAKLGAEASVTERDRLSRGVVLLDPPRAGAGREVVEGVTALAPAAVVYVACDPVALARDIATFRAAGYELREVAGLDLFPNSHHVEAVATLMPAGPRR
ncbi:TRAM domain-containing protein [Microbacterium thalassium]|uniref:class I SAM-dependent RNA methyltransferase n=1 Tax=Microbacterium TaxID=33882 RepID=UPI002948C260|nr:TRAM domain-containing protein [Microbacterium thalassium]